MADPATTYNERAAHDKMMADMMANPARLKLAQELVSVLTPVLDPICLGLTTTPPGGRMAMLRHTRGLFRSCAAARALRLFGRPRNSLLPQLH